MHRKTGSLFEVAFVLGWLYGGGEVTLLPVVKRAAGHFGMAFQIADDFGDQAQDRMNERLGNLVIVLGTEKAMRHFEREVSLYRHALRELGLETSELGTLADLLLSALTAS